MDLDGMDLNTVKLKDELFKHLFKYYFVVGLIRRKIVQYMDMGMSNNILLRLRHKFRHYDMDLDYMDLQKKSQVTENELKKTIIPHTISSIAFAFYYIKSNYQTNN